MSEPADVDSPRVFDCEIQTRFRDINLGGHVDNVEAVRVLDEARIQFFRFAALFDDPAHAGLTGLLARVPPGIVELMGAHRVDYHAEMRFAPYQPFLLRLWITHSGRTSFTVATELRVAPEQPPAVIAESTLVLWDSAAGASWPISDDVRADLNAFAGSPLPLRPRPA